MNPIRWYADPERELLRREVAWTRRWLFRGPGLKWLILYVLISPMGPLALVIQVGMWHHLMQRRTLAFFKKEKLQNLLISRLDGGNLWPALIAAPVFACTALSLIGSAVGLALGVALEGFVTSMSLNAAMGGASGSFTLPEFSKLVIVGQAIVGSITRIFQWIAVSAYVARTALPKGGDSRFILGFIVGWIILWLPVVAFYIGIFTGLIGTTSAGNAPHSVLILAPPTLGVLTAYLVYTFSIRSLRGPGFRRQLERLSQSN